MWSALAGDTRAPLLPCAYKITLSHLFQNQYKHRSQGLILNLTIAWSLSILWEHVLSLKKTCFARRELKNKHRKRVVHDLKIWLLLISPHCSITQHRGKNGELEQAIHMSQLIYSCLSSFGYFVYFMFSLFFFKFKFNHTRKTQLAYSVGRHHLPRPITRKEKEWEGEWEEYEIRKKIVATKDITT